MNDLIVLNNGTVAINGDLNVSGKVTAQTVETNQLLARNNPLTIDIATMSAEILDPEMETDLETETPEEDILGALIIRGNEGQEVASYHADGSTRLQHLAINAEDAGSDQENEDQSEELNSSSGTAILKSGKNIFTIRTTQVRPNSLVYLTATSSTGNKMLYVSVQTDGSFTVAIDGLAHTQDINFNWWVINR